jgi:hypothetical protein
MQLSPLRFGAILPVQEKDTNVERAQLIRRTLEDQGQQPEIVKTDQPGLFFVADDIHAGTVRALLTAASGLQEYHQEDTADYKQHMDELTAFIKKESGYTGDFNVIVSEDDYPVMR